MQVAMGAPEGIGCSTTFHSQPQWLGRRGENEILAGRCMVTALRDLGMREPIRGPWIMTAGDADAHGQLQYVHGTPYTLKVPNNNACWLTI